MLSCMPLLKLRSRPICPQWSLSHPIPQWEFQCISWWSLDSGGLCKSVTLIMFDQRTCTLCNIFLYLPLHLCQYCMYHLSLLALLSLSLLWSLHLSDHWVHIYGMTCSDQKEFASLLTRFFGIGGIVSFFFCLSLDSWVVSLFILVVLDHLLHWLHLHAHYPLMTAQKSESFLSLPPSSDSSDELTCVATFFVSLQNLLCGALLWKNLAVDGSSFF